MNFNSFSLFFIFTIILLIFFIYFTFSSYEYLPYYYNTSFDTISMNSSLTTWPTPGYTKITSYYGSRNSPINGKPSFHYGIDIAAPEGSNIVSIFSGYVSYIGFNGANGYTVKIKTDKLLVAYSHVSSNFIVHVGEFISQGSIIAQVGPKNVYNVYNNPYKDSNGNPTNRCNYWSSFTFKHKRRRYNRQSFKIFLNYISSSSS